VFALDYFADYIVVVVEVFYKYFELIEQFVADNVVELLVLLMVMVKCVVLDLFYY